MEIIIASHNEHKVKEIHEYLIQYIPTIKAISLNKVGIKDDIEENGNTFESNSYIKASVGSYLTNKPVIADDSGLIIDFYTDLVKYYKKQCAFNDFIKLIHCIHTNHNDHNNLSDFWKQYFGTITDVPGIYSKRFGNLSSGKQQNSHILAFFTFFTELYNAFSINKMQLFFDNHNLPLTKNDIHILENFIQFHPLRRTAQFVCTIAYMDSSTSFITHGTVSGLIHTKSEGKNGFGYDPLFYYPKLNKTFAQLSIEEKNTMSHRALALKEFVLKYRLMVEQKK